MCPRRRPAERACKPGTNRHDDNNNNNDNDNNDNDNNNSNNSNDNNYVILMYVYIYIYIHTQITCYLIMNIVNIFVCYFVK